MKAAFKHETKASFLDVTEFILKQCSPLIKPTSSPKQNFIDQKYERTPQINPIDHDPSKLMLTPLCNGLCVPQNIDNLQEFSLDSIDGFQLQSKPDVRSRHHKQKEIKPKCNNDLEMYLHTIGQLNIISEMVGLQEQYLFGNDQEQLESQYYSQYSFSYSYDHDEGMFKQEQNQRQSTIDMSALQFNDAIERFKQNPKKQIIKQMKQIQNTMPEQTLENKKLMIKKLIEKYLLEYETYCYEESWKQLEQYQLNLMIKKITEGLNETFNKKIGQLPFQVRRTKILKYLEKKKKRIWRKKVSYDCRKKVADGRLRIKGKFVTRQQACQQLGVITLQGYTSQEIKYMLQRRLENREYEI